MTVDWSAAQTFLRQSDAAGFIAWVDGLLSTKATNFKLLGAGLREHCFDKAAPEAVASFLTSCLEQAMPPPPPAAPSQQQQLIAAAAAPPLQQQQPTAAAAAPPAQQQQLAAAAAASPAQQQQSTPAAAATPATGPTPGAPSVLANGEAALAPQPPAAAAAAADNSTGGAAQLGWQQRQQQQGGTGPPAAAAVDRTGGAAHLDQQQRQQGGSGGPQPRLQPAANNGSTQRQSTVQHLAIDLLGQYLQQVGPQGVQALRPRGAALLAALMSRADGGTARIAAKVVQSFSLTSADVDAGRTVQYIRQLLWDSSTASPGVAIMMQLPDLASRHFEVGEVLQQLMDMGQERAAEEWVGTMGQEQQVAFISLCIASDRLRLAVHAMRRMGLEAHFPDLEERYAAVRLASLVDKGLWEPAAQLVGEDAAMREALIVAMVSSGDLVAAQEYASHWGLPASVADVSSEAVRADEQRRAAEYLQLSVPQERVLFVDTLRQLGEAQRMLGGSDVIGLDVEWRPVAAEGGEGGGGKGARPASVLQVACRSGVAIFDLLSLAPDPTTSPALDACLGGLLGSDDVIKLGFDVRGDLAKLCASWPALAAPRYVPRVVDLQRCGPLLGLPVPTKREGLSLSKMCDKVLGRPLDKSMRLSNWEQRPLSKRQISYAALDALCLVSVYDALPWAEQEGALREQLRALEFFHDQRPAQDRRRHKRQLQQRQDGSGDWGDGGGQPQQRQQQDGSGDRCGNGSSDDGGGTSNGGAAATCAATAQELGGGGRRREQRQPAAAIPRGTPPANESAQGREGGTAGLRHG